LGTLAENPGIEVAAQPVRDEGTSLLSSSTGGGSLRLSIHKTEVFPGGGQQLSASPFAQASAVTARPQSPQFIHLGTHSGATTGTDSAQRQRIAAALIKAGISNPAAWSAAGLAGGAAGVQVVADSIPELSGALATAPGSLDGFDPHPPAVLMRGVANKTFLISWRSQQEVARSLGWRCTLMIWGGPLLSLFCLYLILRVENLL